MAAAVRAARGAIGAHSPALRIVRQYAGNAFISTPKDTEANAAGRRGVRVCSANGTYANQEVLGTKSLTKSEALAGVVNAENA